MRTVQSEAELSSLFDELKKGGQRIKDPRYDGEMFVMPDGTRVSRRNDSISGGATIDIKFSDGTVRKVHIE